MTHCDSPLLTPPPPAHPRPAPRSPRSANAAAGAHLSKPDAGAAAGRPRGHADVRGRPCRRRPEGLAMTVVARPPFRAASLQPPIAHPHSFRRRPCLPATSRAKLVLPWRFGDRRKHHSERSPEGPCDDYSSCRTHRSRVKGKKMWRPVMKFARPPLSSARTPRGVTHTLSSPLSSPTLFVANEASSSLRYDACPLAAAIYRRRCR